MNTRWANSHPFDDESVLVTVSLPPDDAALLEALCAAWQQATASTDDNAAVDAVISSALRDVRRVDWLADPENGIGNVQLPTEVVTVNLHSLRDAIDAAISNDRATVG